MIQEYWKPVAGWEDFYQVSNWGRVRSIERTVQCTFNGTVSSRTFPSVVRKQQIGTNGYLSVRLQTQQKAKTYSAHVLVAEAFLGPRPPGQDVCHGPEGKLINTPENLSYGTRKQNLADRDRDGTSQKGERGPTAKLSAEQVKEIRSLRRTHTLKMLAEIYGVGLTNISAICRRITWTEI